jgi:hypothetical protein
VNEVNQLSLPPRLHLNLIDLAAVVTSIEEGQATIFTPKPTKTLLQKLAFIILT